MAPVLALAVRIESTHLKRGAAGGRARMTRLAAQADEDPAVAGAFPSQRRGAFEPRPPGAVPYRLLQSNHFAIAGAVH